MNIILSGDEIPADLMEFFEPLVEGQQSSVLRVATQPTSFAHFATFPEKLVEPMIRAGSSERGACPHCGKAWVRNVEREHTNYKTMHYMNDAANGAISGGVGKNFPETKTKDLGFAPACTCPAHEPVPCVVLDPFNGSGTTGKVAVRLGRSYIGVDIAREYLDGVTAERFGAGIQMQMSL
jgi:hypothetical protein